MITYSIRNPHTLERIRDVDSNEARMFEPDDHAAVYASTQPGVYLRVLIWRGAQPWVSGSMGMPEPL